ncbi:unnamed protein product [Caenorhabditis brenneri]
MTSMAKYDERTVSIIYVEVQKKISYGLEVNKGQIHFITWNHISDHIAVGGDSNAMKILRFDFKPMDTNQKNVLQINQPIITLDDKDRVIRGSIMYGTWNEEYELVATSDSCGRVTIWKISKHDAKCYRKLMLCPATSALATGVAWNSEGSKIVIAYSNGVVDVYTWEGNLVWTKNMGTSIAICEWSPVDEMLILGMADGRIRVYDEHGEFETDIQRYIDEECEYFKVPDEIVCMKYWRPRQSITVDSEEIHCPEDRPRFAIVYRRLAIQLMRSIYDQDPVIIRLPGLKITGAEWSPNGVFLAVCRVNTDNFQHSTIHIFTAYGELFCTSHQLSMHICDLTWQASSLRLAIATERKVFIADIRLDYKYSTIGDTFVYCVPHGDKHKIKFFNLKSGELKDKTVNNFESIVFAKDNFVVITSKSDLGATLYSCELYNSNCSKCFCHHTTTRPKFACANGHFLVAACKDRYFIWDFVRGHGKEYMLQQHAEDEVAPEVCSMCIADTFFLLALQETGICRVNLADGVITHRYPMEDTVFDSMKLNSDFTRLAVVKIVRKTDYFMHFYKFHKDQLQEIHFQRNGDVWDYQWHQTEHNRIAIKTQTNLSCFEDMKLLMGTTTNRNIVSYKDSEDCSVITTVHMNEVMLNPEVSPKEMFKTIEFDR